MEVSGSKYHVDVGMKSLGLSCEDAQDLSWASSQDRPKLLLEIEDQGATE